MPMKPIFVSYKRVNKKAVFDLIKKIEDRLKVQCWVDLDGIESSVQFASKICNAIDDSKVFLFMHSSAHLTIDFEEDYTIKELSYARMTHKKVILVKLDDAPLENYFLFEFGSKNYRDISDDDQFERLLSDILKYLKPSSAGYNRNSSAKQHNGNPSEQNDRGVAYYYGNGVKQDYNEAAKWFRKAADDGHHWAQYNMGFCYEFGHGVPKNFSLAESFYKKAAESGHKNAIDALKRFKY